MPSGEQRQACWEKIDETNQSFRLLHPYTSGILSEQLVAIHALFGCLDQVLSQCTDDLVARTKLNWWRQEILGEGIGRSRHPVVRYLDDTGAASALHLGAIEELLAVVERKLDARPPADVDELGQLCCDIYQPRFDIEMDLAGKREPSDAIRRLMELKGGLILLIRNTFNSRRSLENALWWIPLGLLARHGMSRAELAQHLGSDSAKTIFGDIYSQLDINSCAKRFAKTLGIEGKSFPAHVLLGERLHYRQLNRLRNTEPALSGEVLGRLYLRDAFDLWMEARKIAKDLEA